MYEKKCQLNTFLRIYKCINIKHNNILLNIKNYKNDIYIYIYIISIFVIKY